jgi:hypothetical protein
VVENDLFEGDLNEQDVFENDLILKDFDSQGMVGIDTFEREND